MAGETDKRLPVVLRLLGWQVGRFPVAVWVAASMLAVVVPALVPAVRWRHRLGWRGQLRVAVVQTLWLFGLTTWVRPWARRMGRENDERRARVDAELRAELGREPTPEERRVRMDELVREHVDALAARVGVSR